MGEITHFIAMAFDLTDHGLVAGEPFKCRSRAAAIERVKTGKARLEQMFSAVHPTTDISRYFGMSVSCQKATSTRQSISGVGTSFSRVL